MTAESIVSTRRTGSCMVMANVAHHEPIAGYGLTARLFHWLTAILVLIQIPLGILVANFDLGALYNLHKSNGVLILLVVICRLLWRMTHQPPPLSSDIPAIQRLAAHSVHWALYALLIIQPIMGWIATSAYPAPIPFFGLFEMPPIWWADRALSERLFVVHLAIGIVMAGLLAAHIGAALFHHFVRKDGVLDRMLRG
jgi:cytochrome b561